METQAIALPAAEAVGELPARPAVLRRLSPLVLAGPGSRAMAHELLGHLLLRGERVVVLDGSNGFDAYRLAEAARRFRRPPPTLLSAVRVSRAFTWQQWQALLEDEAGAEAQRCGARWIMALGPLDLYADENVKPFQAWRGARNTAEALRDLASSGLGVIAAQNGRVLIEGGRPELMDRLRAIAGHWVTVEPATAKPDAETPAPALLPVEPAGQLAFGFPE